ncbi:hypothetical protein [Globicatella sanguinis]
MDEITQKQRHHHDVLLALLKYDHFQALELEIKQLAFDGKDEILLLVQLANAILQVDNENVKKLAQNTPFQGVLDASQLERKAYYYLQTLTLQLKRQEYGDYLRGLTPLLVDVFRIAIERDFLPNLAEYIQPIKKETTSGAHLYRGLQWSQNKIESHPNIIADTWKKYYGNYFNYDHYVSSSHLMKLIEANSSNEHLIELASTMRKIEKYLRNLVAHEVLTVNQQFFVDRIQRTPLQVHQVLLDLYDEVGLTHPLQRTIIEQIKQQITLLLQQTKEKN